MVHLSSNLSGLILLEMVVLGSELECTDLVVVDWDRTASDGYLETNPERYRPIRPVVGSCYVPTFLGTAVAGTVLVPTIGFLAKLDVGSPSPLQWTGS